jgi:hypothetical protein
MKRLLKILGWTVGIVVAVLIVAVVALWIFFPVEKAKQMAIEKGSAQLGRDIAIQDAAVSFWGGIGVKLGGVAISNPSGMPGDMLTAKSLDVKLSILPLIKGEVRIDRLIVNNPEIDLKKRADGSNNYSFPAMESAAPKQLTEKATPEQKAAAAVISFDKLDINDGNLSYQDDSSHTSFSLRGLNLSTTLTTPENKYYRSAGRITVDTILVTGSNTLPPLEVGLTYNAEYNPSEQLLSFEQSELRLNKLLFKLKGEVTDPLDQMKSRVTIASDNVEVADLLSLVPPSKKEAIQDFELKGNFDLNLDIDYDRNRVDTLAYFGTATFNSLDVSHAKIPGQLRVKKAVIDVKNNNLRMNIEDGSFDDKPIKAHMVIDDFSDPTVNGELAGGLNLVYLEPFLPAKYKQKVSGDAQFDLKISGRVKDYQNIGFSGNLSVTNGSYDASFMLEPIKSFDVDVYFDNRVVSVKKLNMATKSGSLAFDGRINDIVPYLMADSSGKKKIKPTIDGSLKGDLDLAVLKSMLPPKGNPQLSGKLAVDLQVSGIMTQYTGLKPRGSVGIRQGAYNDSLLPEPIKQFDADLVIAPDTISVKSMNVKFVSSDASFSGKLLDPFPYLLPLKDINREKMKKPMFLFTLKSQRFDVDKLFPEASPGTEQASTTAAQDSVSAVILPDIDGRGNFKIDTLIYSKVEFTKIEGQVKIYDRKIECYDVNGDVYTGKITGNTTVDLSNFDSPKYTGSFDASQIEVDDFMKRFTPLNGYLFGKVDMKGTYDASGWEKSDFLKSLTMNSDGSMRQAKLVTSGAVYSAMSGLAEKMGQKFDKEQSLRNLASKVTVKDGKVAVDNLKSKLGDVGDIEVGGYYGFDGAISYKGSILLSQEWTQKLLSKKGLLGDLAGMLTEKSADRIKLPIAFGGTMDQPKFEIDYSTITKNLGDNAKEDAKNLLNNLFKKK